MKLPHSLFGRRQFLNSLLGGWLGGLAATLAYPIVKFIIPPYKEPDQVTLLYGDYRDIPSNTVKTFPWGAKPGLIKKNDDGTLTAYVAVCSHLDCNVSYVPARRRFFCACHDGWYDENGVNVAGPPPRPLRRLILVVEGENLIIKKEAAA